jgi:hypothetical protein
MQLNLTMHVLTRESKLNNLTHVGQIQCKERVFA